MLLGNGVQRDFCDFVRKEYGLSDFNPIENLLGIIKDRLDRMGEISTN